MRNAVVVAAALLPLVAGCPPGPRCEAPASRRVALERVNANLGQIQQPLSCTGLVSFRFRDDRDRTHSLTAQEARLIYRPPQDLYFDVRATLGGSVARFGSNAERYWLWVDVGDARKLWWGTWEHASGGGERRLPVPPNDLLDALLLRPLPESLEGGQLPLLRVDGSDHRLIFVRIGPGHQPSGWREVRLSPCEPYQPVEVVDRLPDGQVVMQARLDHYERVGGAGPYTARRYVVQWPLHAAEMRLDILTARFRSDPSVEVFAFPADWQGDSECLDAGGAEAPTP